MTFSRLHLLPFGMVALSWYSTGGRGQKPWDSALGQAGGTWPGSAPRVIAERLPGYGVKGGGLCPIVCLPSQLHLKLRWPRSVSRLAFALVPSARNSAALHFPVIGAPQISA